MNGLVEAQEASVSLAKRRGRDLRRCSMTSVRSPVSMALELATALKMRARGIVTFALPVDALRIIRSLLKSIDNDVLYHPGREGVSPGADKLSGKSERLSGNPESLSSQSAPFFG